MIIHINLTLQSYLVPEKKMIIFLKHAGATKADVDMNIQLPHSLPRCVTLAVCSRALRDTGWSLDSVAGPPRHNLSSAPSCSKQ